MDNRTEPRANLFKSDSPFRPRKPRDLRAVKAGMIMEKTVARPQIKRRRFMVQSPSRAVLTAFLFLIYRHRVRKPVTNRAISFTNTMAALISLIETSDTQVHTLDPVRKKWTNLFPVSQTADQRGCACLTLFRVVSVYRDVII